MIAAPASGSGKTTITLGLLAALVAQGTAVRSAKSGPDYIDGRFHEAATGHPCVNLDAWAMSPDRLRNLALGEDLLVIEAAMGLFDGAPPDGRGSAADLARHLGVPIVLVIDAARQSHSVAAVAHGFATLEAGLRIAGVILNRVGSARHEEMLRDALNEIGMPVMGVIPNDQRLLRPSRHLGLVQAKEQDDLPEFLETTRKLAGDYINLDFLTAIAMPLRQPFEDHRRLDPPAQRMAIAKDEAFDFLYPHLLADWHAAGAEISFFSPLADEAPEEADLVFLPGGYPELHAGRLAANAQFLGGLRSAKSVYGECGGYMVMGEGLIDADGQRHQMAGLLKLESSFEARQRHLGYRHLAPLGGPWDFNLKGHEFHYATTLKAEGDPLFKATDAAGVSLPPMGLITGNHSGSFAHVIDAELRPA